MHAMTKLESHPAMREVVTFGSGLKFTEPRIWRALIARSAKEQHAADWLKRDRLYVYWPNYERQINAGRRRCRTLLSPVMPGYLFLATRDEANEPSLQALIDVTPGLMGYVRDGSGNAASLTNFDIEIIRRIEAGLNLPSPKKHVHRFKSGDHVRFVDDLLGAGLAAR